MKVSEHYEAKILKWENQRAVLWEDFNGTVDKKVFLVLPREIGGRSWYQELKNGKYAWVASLHWEGIYNQVLDDHIATQSQSVDSGAP